MKGNALICRTITAGTNPRKNPMIGFAYAIMSLETGAVHTTRNLLLRPAPGKTIDFESLRYNGTTRDELDSYDHPSMAISTFVGDLNSVVSQEDARTRLWFFAFSAKFHYDFLETSFRDNGFQNFSKYIWWPPIDLMPLAATLLTDKRHQMRHFNLNSVCSFLDLSHETKLEAALNLTTLYVEKLDGFNRASNMEHY